MAQIAPAQLDAVLLRRRPGLSVETGAFEGHYTDIAEPVFRHHYAVELSPVLAERLRVRFARRPRVTVVEGDTRVVVPDLAATLDGSVCWFFDANWWQRPAGMDPGIAGQGQPAPLWDELNAVRWRSHPDVIIVNEVSTFGTLSAAGRDRRDISVDRIAGLFPGADVQQVGDILVVYR